MWKSQRWLGVGSSICGLQPFSLRAPFHPNLPMVAASLTCPHTQICMKLTIKGRFHQLSKAAPLFLVNSMNKMRSQQILLVITTRFALTKKTRLMNWVIQRQTPQQLDGKSPVLNCQTGSIFSWISDQLVMAHFLQAAKTASKARFA